MTIDEASERYQIPIEVLREYESWGLCGEVKKVMGAWQYDDTDLQRLSVIMTLHDIGFNNAEVESYMRLLLEGNFTEEETAANAEQKRGTTLDEIHSSRNSWIAWITCGTKSKKHKKYGGYQNEEITLFGLYVDHGVLFGGLWGTGRDTDFCSIFRAFHLADFCRAGI